MHPNIGPAAAGPVATALQRQIKIRFSGLWTEYVIYAVLLSE